MRKTIVAIWILLFTVRFSAQAQTPSLNRIPLNEEISVTLLGCDKTTLYCYNLYGFNYNDGVEDIVGEFIVFRDKDTFQNKEEINIKFCRVTEFSIMSHNGGCKPIPASVGIQLDYKDGKEPLFLNFDPSGPEPVFIPCK
ncbi:MAG: hypothetical protein H6551_00485 [Chitinophagales bacterium]|nr:hypothetical protein [Chitinophagaceae bacterium]MCB9063598.1 hypothetical protein [Chitinophagales bacterium]